jgi:solute carrier family 25 protein 39/40
MPKIFLRLIGVPSSTVYMLTYDHLLRNVLPPLIPSPTLVPLFAGITARTCLTSLLSPLELIRTNLQSTPKSPDQPHTLSSVLRSIRMVVRKQGVFFLWRGLGPTLWRDVPFSGIYWAGYESWKRHFESHGKSGAYVSFASGAISGTTASLLTSPFDVLKTRRQALLMQGTMPSRTTATIPLCLRIVQTEGISALYAGMLPRTAKIAPACGIMIACFEVRSLPAQLERFADDQTGSWQILGKGLNGRPVTLTTATIDMLHHLHTH